MWSENAVDMEKYYMNLLKAFFFFFFGHVICEYVALLPL